MSHKDYQAISAIVSRHIYGLNDAGIALVSDLADYLESDNVKFDRDRFVDACVPGPVTRKRLGKRASTYVGLALDEWSN